MVLTQAMSCATMLALNADNLYANSEYSHIGLIDLQDQNLFSQKFYSAFRLLDCYKVKHGFDLTKNIEDVFWYELPKPQESQLIEHQRSWLQVIVDDTRKNISSVYEGMLNGCLKNIQNKESIAKEMAVFLMNHKSYFGHQIGIPVSYLKKELSFEYKDYMDSNIVSKDIGSDIQIYGIMLEGFINCGRINALVQDKQEAYY